VRFTDGRQESYDLVAAFDGIKSATRRAVFGPARDAVYSGFGVFRVTLPRPEYVDGVRVYQALGVKAGCIPLSKEYADRWGTAGPGEDLFALWHRTPPEPGLWVPAPV